MKGGNRYSSLNQITGDNVDHLEVAWTYKTGHLTEGSYVINCRGVSTWLDESAPEGSACRRRIILGTMDARMLEIDSRSGVPCSNFGVDGQIDLRAGLG